MVEQELSKYHARTGNVTRFAPWMAQNIALLRACRARNRQRHPPDPYTLSHALSKGYKMRASLHSEYLPKNS
jgi:hypothetical protein